MSLECDAKEGFTTVQAKLGAKQVDKLAKCTLNTYINDMVYDILNNALDKPTGVQEEEGKVLEERSEEQDRQLQLSSQVEKFSKWFPEVNLTSTVRSGMILMIEQRISLEN